MKVETTRFGEIEIEEHSILNFVEPIFGYENYSKYTIIEHNGNDMFQWLQCIENPELAFPISIPGYFNIKDYIFEIDDTTAEKIEAQDANNLMIYNIVTIPVNNPKSATINLLGPIIINTQNNKALQYVVTNSSYSSRYPLFELETV